MGRRVRRAGDDSAAAPPATRQNARSTPPADDDNPPPLSERQEGSRRARRRGREPASTGVAHLGSIDNLGALPPRRHDQPAPAFGSVGLYGTPTHSRNATASYAKTRPAPEPDDE